MLPVRAPWQCRADRTPSGSNFIFLPFFLSFSFLFFPFLSFIHFQFCFVPPRQSDWSDSLVDSAERPRTHPGSNPCNITDEVEEFYLGHHPDGEDFLKLAELRRGVHADAAETRHSGNPEHARANPEQGRAFCASNPRVRRLRAVSSRETKPSRGPSYVVVGLR